MILSLIDLATLAAAIVVGLYILLARRVHLTSHGWGCALWHLGAAGICAAAAVDALHGQSGAWPLLIAVVAFCLTGSRYTWHAARPRRRPVRAVVAPQRGGGVGEERAAAVVMRGGGVGEE